MYKLKEMILMLCFILSGALCYAHGEKERRLATTYRCKRKSYSWRLGQE